ncbi:MAG: single-stranded-DNA-specific exonuclease RecJ [Atopobiaceae bacterium]|nr:single-stranded-DNA-specific exonuclease RecJ [Atopobiaceae bacterium]
MARVVDSKRWEILPSNGAAERRLVEELGIDALPARVMVARGITSPEAAHAFLHPSLERDWAHPFCIPGMREVADRVEQALLAGEKIAVFGDFDVDGMSSTALLTLGLRDLGAEVYPFIPHRFDEGYGLSQKALMRVIEACQPSLVVTVDNGIASSAEIDWISDQGVDVVVTDHHEPAGLVPQGIPVTDPKLSLDCPSRELAGAGVALKLLCVLGERFGKPNLWRSYTDYASLGTISDMMLLVGENRALVADGMARMQSNPRPGLVALAAVAGVELSELTAANLPFTLVPRLNAAGRMGKTDVALNLMLTRDATEAMSLAEQLESINLQRRQMESELVENAMAMVEESYTGGRVIVVGGEGWHEGVKGIVASKLVSKYHVPALLFTIEDGIARGSGRSVGSIDLFHVVEQCSDVLVRFGGHAGAVGITVEASRLNELRDRLEQVLSAFDEESFEDRGEITALVSMSELTPTAITSLDMLEPFGQGNKLPIFATCGVTMRSRARVGQDGDHLRFIATDGIHSVSAISFRTNNVVELADYDGAVDLVFEAIMETWQGRTRPKLMIKDILMRSASENHEMGEAELVEHLFDRAEQICARESLAGIVDRESFFTKIVGVSFEERQQVVRSLVSGEALVLRREPDNAYDHNAIAFVRGTGEKVGYLRSQIAQELAPALDAGANYVAHVRQLTGGDAGKSIGVNIEVRRLGATGILCGSQETPELMLRRELVELDETSLVNKLRETLIGNNQLLPAQQAAIDALAQGKSTLVVMATGRGKSLIFHIHAAREAIMKSRASVFVYPLRALVADQSFHLGKAFSSLGMETRVLTGETSTDERDEIFSALTAGAVDVLLTTPEFLAIHAERFAESGRVGFVVVDEAHHAAGGKSLRSAYQEFPRVLETLGHPVLLACSATSSTETSSRIAELFSIDEVIVDDTVRENLLLIDDRELPDREAALVSCVASGDKTVVYVNSREQSVSLARTLRRRIPELADRIAFYNAGLTRKERLMVEEAFRNGNLCCIVSTSAFGEGVNLPDIRNVVLYHMPFGSIEFNQMSGRAGRDGNDAQVHIMFGVRDSRINDTILSSAAPSRAELATLYRVMRNLSQNQVREQGDAMLHMSNSQLADACHEFDPKSHISERSVSCGVSVFRELGFLTTSGYGSARRILMVESPHRMELGQSIRYQEGMRSLEEFGDFRDWVLHATTEQLLDRINRPITPDFGTRVGEGTHG